MPKRRRRPPDEDFNQIAARTIAQVSGEPMRPSPELGKRDDGKNPAAVALGRLGGLKGGPARKAKLSKARRAAIAKKAATARWKKTRRA